MKKLHRNQFGDTIVEVLLAIAVLSFVLGISYSLATRGYRNLQVAKDHMQATFYAQEQAEALRAIRDSRGWDDFRSYIGSQNMQFRLEAVGGEWVAVNDLSTPVNGFFIEVDRNPGASAAASGIGGFRDTDGNGQIDSFGGVIRIRWEQIGSGAEQTVEVVTRLRDI